MSSPGRPSLTKTTPVSDGETTSACLRQQLYLLTDTAPSV